jgi:signal transduction histidine kinase
LEPDSGYSAAVIGFALVGLVALAAQPRQPYPGVAVMVAGNLLAPSWGGAATPYLVCLGLALYRLAVARDRRAAWLSGAAVAGLYLAAVANGVATMASWGDLVWAGMMLALGDAARSRRQALAASQERADRAERTRELEAAKAVADERLRIARDVHDSIGHRMAVVAVHSAVAAHLVETNPPASRQALDHVREASVTVLDELTSLVNALRDSDGVSEPDPPVGLEGLARLLDSFGRAGLRVGSRVRGAPKRLAATADQAAYRIVQESLTNAAQHGGVVEPRSTAARPPNDPIRARWRRHSTDVQSVFASAPPPSHPSRAARHGDQRWIWAEAEVELRYGPTGLLIRVSNPLGPEHGPCPAGEDQASRAGRNGIVGMAERAHSAGGSLTARRLDDKFVVLAVLPYAEAAAE